MRNQSKQLPLIKPPRLRFGDVVGIVSPSSPPADPNGVARCVDTVNDLGFKPRLARHAHRRLGFLAGSDQQRADDLMQMFADRDVKAIFCVRGGYGTARFLRLLDFSVIRQNPKPLIGYSDITSLHCALARNAGLVSFHGPMLYSGLAIKTVPDFTRKSFLRAIMEPVPAGSICQNYRRKTVSTIRNGRVRGPLVGGNLALLCSTIGTSFEPVFKNTILLLEDVDEVPYRFDRLLTHLLNAGKLQQVAGVAVGINHNCVDRTARREKEYRQSLDDVLKERLLPLQVPVVTGLPFGHIPWNATLPLGIAATLDGDRGDLIITDAAVT